MAAGRGIGDSWTMAMAGQIRGTDNAESYRRSSILIPQYNVNNTGVHRPAIQVWR